MTIEKILYTKSTVKIVRKIMWDKQNAFFAIDVANTMIIFFQNSKCFNVISKNLKENNGHQMDWENVKILHTQLYQIIEKVVLQKWSRSKSKKVMF